MTLLGAIPFDRALDRTDMAMNMNAPYTLPDYYPGPFNPAKYDTVLNAVEGWCLAFGTLTGYWTTTGQVGAALHVEQYAGSWQILGHIEPIITFNYTGSHEVFAPGVQVWEITAAVTSVRVGMFWGGNSDTNDYATMFILERETI